MSNTMLGVGDIAIDILLSPALKDLNKGVDVKKKKLQQIYQIKC